MNPRYLGYAQARLRAQSNVHFCLGDSRQFLRRLIQDSTVPKDKVFFYLDAHWQEDLPLREEVDLIFRHWSRPVVMIDDFQVPDDSGYQFDDFRRGNKLSLEYLYPIAHLGFVPFFPALPSSEEVGFKRGWVVLAGDGFSIDQLRGVAQLREWRQPNGRPQMHRVFPPAFPRAARCEELREELCNVGNGGNRTVKALNLGCGERVHPDWINIDKGGRRPGVRAWDLSRGIPFPDGEFDVVYHSHLLEHFPRNKAQAFLRDCFRVTRPGGVIRVAVPDLERITRLYLENLERALCGDSQGMWNYEWMTLEMYDQTVREKSGGGMTDYLQQVPLPNEEFVIERFGGEARRVLSQIRAARARTRRDPTFFSRFDFQFRKLWRQRRFFFLWLFLSKERYEALRLGLFRRAGEVHLWMYDRYSLARALETAGFSEPRRVAAAESRISGWKDFGLDTEPDGAIYKPDSLFMEAVKP